jgi:hypothetical protein
MASLAEIKKKVADAKLDVKNADDLLKRLGEQLRAYYNVDKLSPEQTAAAKKIVERIKVQEAKKAEASKIVNDYEPKIEDLGKIEDIDRQINVEIASYKKALALGQTPNKSKINSLYREREGLAKNVGSLAPEAPKLPDVKPTSTTAANTPTGTTATSPVTTTATTTNKPVTTTKDKNNKPVVTGGMPVLPTGEPSDTGITATSGFNPAGVRATDQGVSTGITPITPGAVTGNKDLKGILAKTEFWYDLPDYIFETIPELGDLLVKAVNEGWDEKKFLSAAKLTKWWQSNSEIFRTRIVDKAKYNELRSAGQDVSKTDYGQYISKQIRNVKAQAKSIAGVALTDAQAQAIAEKIYDGNLDDDPLAINRLIIPYIGKVTDRYGNMDVTTYGGQALQNYQMLQGIAKANGLTLKDILPQISTALTGGDLEKAVLQALAAGDIDITRMAQNARMIAAQGQPEYVRNLLNQGYDLEQVYAPYKRTMATVLELQPDQIDLNDATLRSAINNNGDMNIYDFKKALRKDSRWQYTENAREEIANTTLGILRDFGFQG